MLETTAKIKLDQYKQSLDLFLSKKGLKLDTFRIDLSSLKFISINDTTSPSWNIQCFNMFPNQHKIKKSPRLLLDELYKYVDSDYIDTLKKLSKKTLSGKNTAPFIFPIKIKGFSFYLKRTVYILENIAYILLEDINTDTKEEALRLEQNQIATELTQLIATANAPIFGTDINGKINEWNNKTAELTGFKKKEVLGKELVPNYVGKDYQKEVETVLNNALNNKETANYTLPLAKKDGSQIILLINASTRRNALGDVIGVVGVAQDITKEEALRLEQQKISAQLELITKNINGFLYTFKKNANSSYSVLYISEGCKLLYDVSPEDVIKDASKLFDCVHLDDLNSVIESIENSATTMTQWNHSWRIIVNGTIKTLSANSIPKKQDDGSIIWTGVCMDISKQTLQEQAIKDTIEHANIIATGDFTANIKPQSDSDTLGIALHKMTQTLREVAKVAEGVSEGNFTTKIREKGNNDLLAKSINKMSSNLFKLHKENENVKTQLLQAPSLLQSQKMEVVGRLAGGIAHDFNNALGVIHPTIQLLMSDTRDPELLALYKVIMHSSEQAKNVVKQLLQFARQQETIKESLNLNILLTDIEPIISKIIDNSHSLSIQTMDEPIVIYGDSSQIQQVLLNMAVNSNDSMENGGSFTIRLTKQTIEEKEEPQYGIKAGYYAKISISDTGKGIPNDTQDKIFTPFFTTKPQGKGTGLGLSVSHGVIQAHGGRITCDSEVGVCTTLTIYLPVFSANHTANADFISQKLVDGQGKKVLVIDDDQQVGMVTCNVLKKLNYTVDFCDNTIDGIEKYKASGHDIIVLDYQMDNINGIQSYYMFKEINPHIKALLYTGDLYSDDIRSFSEKESVLLVYKPLDLYQLSSTLIAIHG